MANILILGGTGYTGRLIAEYLLEWSDAKITLAARHVDKARELANHLNQATDCQRVTAVHADAADVASLQAAFQGQSLILVAAPTTAYAHNVVHSAIQVGVDYLDVQLSAQKLAILKAHQLEIERCGLCFITEAGFHPGLPAALVRYAAAHLDTIEHVITAGYLNMGKELPYTEAFDELIETFKEYQAGVFKDGNWCTTGSYELRKIDFGQDIGLKRCYAMFFEELRLLPDLYPSLKELGFYMSETHWMTDWVIMPLTWLWLKVQPGAVRSIGKFLWWGMGTFHRPPYRVELQVHASGLKDDKQAVFHARVAHRDGYVLTAIPVVATISQYLDGSARKPGLWMMGHLAEPMRLMQDMERMGIQVKNEEK